MPASSSSTLHSNRWWLKYVGPCYSRGRPALSPCLWARMPGPGPAVTGISGINQWMEQAFMFVSVSLILKKKLNPSKIISYWYSLGLWSILRKGDWVSFVFFGYLLLIIGISLLMPVSALQEILLISVCILWLGQEQKENEDKSINNNTENKGKGNNVRVSFLTAVQQIRALRLVWGVCKNRASPPPTNHIVLMISCLCNPIM